MDHQRYLEERLEDHERRPPSNTASDRLREQWTQSGSGLRQRIQDFHAFFASFPAELIKEARAIRPEWGSKATVGARRSYDSLLPKMRR